MHVAHQPPLTAKPAGLASHELDAVCQLVDQLCGIKLDSTKSYLIESRLAPILRAERFASYGELVTKARGPAAEPLRQSIINAITTQETLFFRDSSPFDALRCKAIPETIDSKAASSFPKRLRIWSAASSTGQEAYSIAITLHELISDVCHWDVQILATDISDAAITRASRGIYSELEINRGMSPQLRDKYFVRCPDGWKVSDKLRALVSFRKLNLLAPFNNLGPFDIVFCRNVAIYFETQQRLDLFRRMKQIMTREAYLFVGASESLHNLGPDFQPHAHCRAIFYRPNLTSR